MFDDVMGLSPAAAARLTALVERCRPVLEDLGMEAVQVMLVEDGVSTIQAIAVTRALLGQAATPLRVAVEVVVTSGAWREYPPRAVG